MIMARAPMPAHQSGHDKPCRDGSQSKSAASSGPLIRGRKQASGANAVGARSGLGHRQAEGLGGAPARAAEPAIEGLPAARAYDLAWRDGVGCIHRAIIPRGDRRHALLPRVSSRDLVRGLMIRLAAEEA